MRDLKQRILDAILPEVTFDGWTDGALTRGAAAAGISAFELRRNFPGGLREILSYFSACADAEMIATLQREYHLPSMKIRERIATAVMVRLRAHTHQREAIRRAVGFYTQPWNSAAGLKALYATVDAIWREAGDTSTDYNFYTKRLLLAKVYSSTLSVWLNDRTDDLSETEAFLRRRIKNVMQIEKLKAKAKESFGKLEAWLPKFGR